MPVVLCPNCRAELDLDADDAGHRVECPACLAAFTAELPPPPPADPPPADPPPAEPPPVGPAPPELLPTVLPPPLLPPDPPPADVPPPVPPAPEVEELTAEEPPPPPPVATARPAARPSGRTAGEPLTLKCPACRGSVSVLTSDLGHKVECPMCRQVFRADDPERTRDDDRDGRRRSRWRDDDDRPRSRRRGRYDDGYDDDRGYEDPYESDDPKAWVWKAKRDLGTPGGGLEVLGYLDLVSGLLSILIGVLFAFGFGGGGASGAAFVGGTGWQMVWLNLAPGVSGIVLGVLKAMGGRAVRQVRHRGLGLAACVSGCVPLNVSLCMSFLMGPAYIVSIVFGIMGFALLFKKGVRKAFEANRPDGDVDAV